MIDPYVDGIALHLVRRHLRRGHEHVEVYEDELVKVTVRLAGLCATLLEDLAYATHDDAEALLTRAEFASISRTL